MRKFLHLTALLALTALAVPAEVAAELRSQLIRSGLSNPVRVVAPVGDDRIFVVERAGLIRVFDRDGTVDRGVFLDVRHLTRLTSERGLLGLAFPQDYASTGRFYISLTDPSATAQTESQIYRYQVGPDPDTADASSGELLLTEFQPASNHNGGHIEFGPDGMLYFGLGDGGGANDPSNYAQNPQSRLGKLLRLDVSGPGLPVIPPDNPFVGGEPLDEIWALGLRNPWCFSFDRLSGDLYIADVGQNRIEEINVQPAGSGGGENYGWRLMEGSDCFNPPTDCNDGSLELPVHEYAHGSLHCSVSGGYVYRGSAIAAEYGAYFFADFCSARIWTLRWTPGGGASAAVNRTAELTGDVPFSAISSFGQDGFGELYIIENGPGRIHRIVAAPGTPAEADSVGRFKGRW